MMIVIGNKAELDADSVNPTAVEFNREGGGVWQIPSANFTYSSAGIFINLPTSSVTFTGKVSLRRILATSAHGLRVIWP